MTFQALCCILFERSEDSRWLAINPAEDINNIDCFCAFASFDAEAFFMSVTIVTEVKTKHAKRKGS